MDFSLTDDQKAAAELAGQIFRDRATLDRLRELEAGLDRIDRELWAELAKADLLGLCLPESVGGGGYGFLEQCLMLQEQGRAVAPVPLLATLVYGAMPIARFGSAEQHQRVLPGVIAGETILTAAFVELDAGPRDPQVRATAAGDGSWILDGVKIAVPFAEAAALMLVPARTPDGPAVFLVDPRGAGVTLDRQETFNWEPEAMVTFAGAAGELLGSVADGATTLDWMLDRATTGVCAVASGAAWRGLQITAEYTTNRKQFDRAIATFQAVGQRAADSYIDCQAMELTMLQAATRLAEEMPSDKEVATAKYWCSEGGHRVGHACLHLHGGISIDVDYPIHRYFLWLKQAEFTLGSATPQLVRLGALVAAGS